MLDTLAHDGPANATDSREASIIFEAGQFPLILTSPSLALVMVLIFVKLECAAIFNDVWTSSLIKLTESTCIRGATFARILVAPEQTPNLSTTGTTHYKPSASVLHLNQYPSHQTSNKRRHTKRKQVYIPG